MSAPRISVLLPVRDAAPTLAECLASLAGQTLGEHEAVIVDDGSSDATPRILAEASARDPRLRVVRTPPRGLVAALNTGLAQVRSPFVARMDADDVALPERLEAQLSGIRASGDDVLATRVELFGGGGGNAGMRRYVAWQNALLSHDEMTRELFVECPLVHPSVVIPTASLRALDGWRDDGPEDYDLWLRGRAAGWRFSKLPEVLLRWRDHGSRLTRTDPRYAEDAFRERKLRALLAGPLSHPARPLVIWGAGPVGKWWARAVQRAGRRLTAFVEVDPRKLGQRIHGAPVLGIEECPGQGPLHLAAVAGPDARARIRGVAAAAGLRDGWDLIAVA